MNPNSKFSRINVRADSQTGEIDFGFLAECLIFYDCVYVLGTAGDLERLVQEASVDGLQQLFDLGALRFLMHPKATAVFTADRATARERYDFAFFADMDQRTKTAMPMVEMVANCTGDSKLANSWLTGPKRFIQNSGMPKLDLAHARKQLLNGPLLESLLKNWLLTLLPAELHLHKSVSLQAWELSKSYQVVTNVDFVEVAEALRDTYKTESRFEGLDIAHFLSFVLDAYADMYFAAHTNADIAKTSFGSPILEDLACHSLKSMNARIGEIHTFQHHVLDNSFAISEAINSGARSFNEVIPIVKKSRLFKKWLAHRNPDVSLVSAYLEDVTKETWVETLPGKAARWLTLGIASKAADAFGGSGLIIELLDAIVTDRLIKGWRPNQFVNGSVKKFTS